MMGTSDVLISRQEVIEALKNEWSDWNCDYNVPVDRCIDAIYSVPIEHPTLYGYKLEHLATIATILKKEGLQPDRVAKALTDIDRIIYMVRGEFAEQLTKSLSPEQKENI